MQHRLVQQCTRKLAIDGEHVDERETPKLRTRQRNTMQLATCEAQLSRNLTGEICVEDSFVLPLIV